MRAVVLESPQRFRVEERAEPVADDGRVLVRIESVGLCGTDVSIFSGKIPVDYPRVLGHEMVGVVESETPHLECGARVVVDPNLYCGHCYQCSKGQTNVCVRAELMGRDRDGALQDLIEVPAANLYALPSTIDPRHAALVQVLTTCMHAQRQTPLFPEQSTLVYGLGVTGLLHIQLARARGSHPLIGVTRSSVKRELAERLGADMTVDPADPLIGEKILDVTGGRGCDVVIECVGRVETLARSIEVVRIGGHLTVFGTITADRGSLPFYQLYYKEISVSNPRAAKPEDYPDCLGMIGSGRVQLEPLVTHRFPLESALEAIEATIRPDSLKVVLDHGGSR